MQDLLVSLDDGQPVNREFLCLVVVSKSLVVPHVPLKLIFGRLLLAFLSLKAITLLSIFEFVALVIASSAAAVLGPRQQANPAKIVLARMALHVVAAWVLFDWFVAFGARFRVRHDPGQVFTLCIRLMFPFLDDVAGGRGVLFSGAKQTSFITTFALTICLLCEALHLKVVVTAALLRAPSNWLIEFTVLLEQIEPVLGEYLRILLQAPNEGRVGHHHIAFILLTRRFTHVNSLHYFRF
jgi:hypothetical protein